MQESPENELTQYGEFVKEIIEILPDGFHVSIHKYAVMSNHIHLIIEINNDNKERTMRGSPHDHIIRDNKDYQKI